MKKKFILVLDGYSMMKDLESEFGNDKEGSIHVVDTKENIEILNTDTIRNDESIYCNQDNFYFCNNIMELSKYIEDDYGKAENACIFSITYPFIKMDVDMYCLLTSGRIIKIDSDDIMHRTIAIGANFEERSRILNNEVNETTPFIKEECMRYRADKIGESEVNDEDVSKAVSDSNKNSIRTELDLIGQIASSNNLEGPVQRVIVTEDNTTSEYKEDYQVNDFLTKVLNRIVMDPDEELRYTESYFPREENPFSYEVYFKNGKIVRSEDGEFEFNLDN